MRKKIAVLASGNGTNAENIIRYFQEKSLACVALVLTNRQSAFVLERSRGLGVPCFYFSKGDWENGEPVLSVLQEHNIDFVVLDRKSTRLNSSHMPKSRMPSSA